MQHRPLGCAAPVAHESLSSRAGRSFVEAVRQHVRTRWKFRAETSRPRPAHLNRIASDTRTTGYTTRRFLVDSSSRSETPPSFSSIEKITLITPEILESGRCRSSSRADARDINKHVIHHTFCKTCGIKPFANGQGPNGPMVAINVRTLEDVDTNKLPTNPYDGRAR